MTTSRAGWKLGLGLILAALLPGFIIAAGTAGMLGAAEGAGLAGGAIILAYGLLGALVAVALSLLAVRWLPRGVVRALLFVLLGSSVTIAALGYLRISANQQQADQPDREISAPTATAEPATTQPAKPVTPAATGRPIFHTDPSCWPQPRNYHQPATGTEWADQVRLFTSNRLPPEQPGVFAPNRAYQFWITTSPDGGRSEILINNEQSGLVVLELVRPLDAPAPRWLNEKLLYLRVAWGRIVFSDLLIDVEQVQVLYHELVHDGSIAFQQYRQACSGPDAHECECQNSFNLNLTAPANRLNENSLIGLLAMPQLLPGRDSGQTFGALPGYLNIDGEYRQITDALDVAIIETREYGYEQPGAAVYARDQGWFSIRTLPAGRDIWIQPAGDFEFYPVAELLPDRLNYLNGHWNGMIWAGPGGNLARQRPTPAWQQKPGETPVVIQQTRMIGDQLWLKVDFYSGPICVGPQPAIEEGGWIPAYSDTGHLTTWFFSRGC